MDERRPEGWHTVTPRIVVEDAAGLVAFIKIVFDGTGEIVGDAPAIIILGDSRIMIGEAGRRDPFPAFLYVYVRNADETFAKAIQASAVALEEVWNTPYGVRRGMFRDRWGNTWQVAARTA